MRALSAALLASVIAPVLLAGCACGLEEASDMAGAARSKREGGDPAEALRRLAKAGDCVRGDAADGALRERYLLAAIYFNMHLLGAPSAFPVGDPEFAWAVEALRASGSPDFLGLAFSEMLTLEKQTFTIEGVPGWATVDRLLISADAMRVRAEGAVAGLPPDAVQGVPAEFAAAQLRIAVLEICRGFCVQAWRRALEAGESAEPARVRLMELYRSMADAWERIAGAASGEAARREAAGEVERVRGLAERAAIVITPEDLGHPVDREMLKLLAEDQLREGRRGAMQGFDEKKTGNHARAQASLHRSLTHFVLALGIGVPDGTDRISAVGYLHDVLVGLRELER
ncbi:MAG: hypothetical protein IT452_21330 [Planctomycetia bacterium]|nr:hypothetical protein [Planctomycetia bacterium]